MSVFWELDSLPTAGKVPNVATAVETTMEFSHNIKNSNMVIWSDIPISEYLLKRVEVIIAKIYHQSCIHYAVLTIANG